jgi:hypothetical protein
MREPIVHQFHGKLFACHAGSHAYAQVSTVLRGDGGGGLVRL